MLTDTSIRKVIQISAPLMISSFLNYTMMIFDRIIVSIYSLEALTSITSAATFAWTFTFSLFLLGRNTESFVAQYNGAARFRDIGPVLWQMIWISLFSITLFFPIAYWGSKHLFSSSVTAELSSEYFFWIVCFGPFYPLQGTLSAYFIGQGKVKYISYVAISANIVNILLDYIFVFGWGPIPCMGVKGAAFATNIGIIFQCICFAIFIFQKKNIVNNNLLDFRLRWNLLVKYLKVGIPISIGSAIEMFGWGIFYLLISQMDVLSITTAALSEFMILIFFFFAEGIGEGILTISGNLMGAKKEHLVPSLHRSAIKIHLIFAVFSGIIIMGLSDFWIQFIFDFKSIFIEESISHLSNLIKTYPQFMHECRIILIFTWFYLISMGLKWNVYSILAAAGDTLFISVTNIISIWTLCVLPVYFIVFQKGYPSWLAFMIAGIYDLITYAIYLKRYSSGIWKKIRLKNILSSS